MKIKKLEIVGFKSFADRGRLIFGEGITGVVGPNGCGKSNIVDAIRWCMGEMSAKHLRGRAMQDVIFGGCTTRGPMGMAEVTLTFTNDGDVPPMYASYSEIAVSRRLFRDGRSEYLINKTIVRLKDITDLFLGTGVGTRAYSIIEQGRIGFVVNSKPEERRSLIEEVAGITKFKARKKAAERRMEATEQNLLRVNDVVAELDRQLGSLRRQAKKAERYKELKEELRDLELHESVLHWLRMQTEHKVLTANEIAQQQTIEDMQRAMLTDESGLDAKRLQLLEQERELQISQQASAELDAKLAALERDLEHWRHQLVDSEARAHAAAGDVEMSRQRIDASHAEVQSLADQIVALAEQTERHRTHVTAAQLTADELKEEVSVVDEEIEMLRQEAYGHMRKETEMRALAASLQARRDGLSERLEQGTDEREELHARRSDVEPRATALMSQRAQTLADLDLWRAQLADKRTQLQTVMADIAVCDQEIQQAKDHLSDRRSRLASLQEIARRLEGYSDGVRTLLGGSAESDVAGGNHHGADQSNHHGPAVPGLCGLVTDIVRVPSAYEQAVEAVLGDKLQYVIVENQEAGAAGLAYLRTHGGRSGFIPQQPRAGKTISAASLRNTPGVIGCALDLVEAEAEHTAIVSYLLGDVWIVESLQIADAIWEQGGTDAILVTLSGDVLEPSGVLAGGADSGAGLLAQRREIRELIGTVQTLTEAVTTAQQAGAVLAAKRTELDGDIQTLDKQIRAGELASMELGKDLELVQAELKRTRERLDHVERTITQCAEQLAEIESEELRAEDEAEAAKAQKAELDMQMVTLQERRQVQANQLSSHMEDLTALKVQLAADTQKLSAAQAAQERLNLTQADLQQRIARDQQVISEGQTQVQMLTTRIAEGEALAHEQALVAQERRTALVAARGVYEADRERISNVEQRLKEGRHGTDALNESLMQIRIDLQRLAMEQQRLRDHVLERHDVVLEKIICDYHLRPQPGEEERRRKDEIDRSIKSMGAINLTAIEECAEVENRYTFLVAQRDDLNEALNVLKRAIAQINRASRERFQEAFDAINTMFQKVFPRLFRGGEARLELVGTDDLLEAGVDIIAMPPGKKLQNVGLLSGGEKALTATALVFSIFLIKPSPFCILDEVDAPLDEANVGRFNEMLREICKFSQFIVITHNKQTMLSTDRLYGITMEEPGMSKVVSVDLQQTQDDAERAA